MKRPRVSLPISWHARHALLASSGLGLARGVVLGCVFVGCVFVGCVVVGSGAALAQDLVDAGAEDVPPDAEYDDDAPDEDWVWVDGDELEDGTVQEGFYRERSLPDYTWVDGHYSDSGTWIGPHWKWVGAARPDMVWVPGHRGPDGFWVRGFWRPSAKAGMTWVEAEVVDGEIVHAHWQPVEVRSGYVWMPGHWLPDGKWIEGHWLASVRAGRVWQPGHWRYGRYVRGYWAPTAPNEGHVWVAGYHGPKGWVSGFWRPNVKRGFYWVPGHWGSDGWVMGSWARGHRPALKRRFRVVRVDQMKAHRIGDRRLWRKGKAQRKLGKAQVRAGAATKAVGAVTGNKKLEKKGDRMIDRGKVNKRRGANKKKRARR